MSSKVAYPADLGHAAVEHLARADKVLVLDSTGIVREQRQVNHVSEQQGFIQGSKSWNNLEPESDHSQIVPSQSHAASAAPTATVPPVPEEDGMQRQRGDVTLYIFYIKSIGKLLFSLWLCTVAVSAVSDKVPRE